MPVDSYKCVVCERELKSCFDCPLNFSEKEDLVNDGNVAEFVCGFGSIHDHGGTFLFAICDDCITAKCKSGVMMQLSSGIW